MKTMLRQAMIDWEAAMAVAAGAVREAERLGVKINVAVVDRAGHPAAFLRMPGAPFHSIGIAEDKAYTAVSFGVPTSEWAEISKGFSPMVAQGLAGRPRLAMFGGGVPIVVEGECIGAAGVSGASEQQDEQCALAGIATITD